jgi:U3 small nucleolar RNA-associated protein 25
MDPFVTHFANPCEKQLSRKLQAVSQNKWRSIKRALANGSRLSYACPDTGEDGTHLPLKMGNLSKLKVGWHVQMVDHRY